MKLLGTVFLNVLTFVTALAVLPPLYRIWDTRRIPFQVDPSLDINIRYELDQAFQDINVQNENCVNFEDKTANDIDYLTIEPGVSCETVVGRTGGEQVLKLSSTCAGDINLSHGEIAHELLHTLGFNHEHQRSDRDSYITVELDNVFGFAKKNFYDDVLPLSRSIESLSYDYESLTHYGQSAFSFNTLPTIQTKDPTKSGLIGQRQRLSLTDIQKIKMYYNCDSNPILSQCSELPPQPIHGRWTTVQGVVQDVGHMIRYTCDSGYTLIGPTNRTCLLDGSWLAYNPTCVDSPLHYCNFDDDSWCGWTQSYTGQRSDYWRLNRRGTADTYTGPNNDYTTMASNGYFAYVEASNAKEGDVAILTSPVIRTSSSDTCLTFAYSMFGRYIGTLSAYYKVNGQESWLFTESGGQGPGWKHTASLHLPSDTEIQVVFKLTMTGSTKCDMALDDLLITECSKIHL